MVLVLNGELLKGVHVFSYAFVKLYGLPLAFDLLLIELVDDLHVVAKLVDFSEDFLDVFSRVPQLLILEAVCNHVLLDNDEKWVDIFHNYMTHSNFILL